MYKQEREQKVTEVGRGALQDLCCDLALARLNLPDKGDAPKGVGAASPTLMLIWRCIEKYLVIRRQFHKLCAVIPYFGELRLHSVVK